MTYCVAARLNAGLVFLSDSRTNAGIDQISTFRKAMVYERTGDRFITLLSAGNLSISQSIREILQTHTMIDPEQELPVTIWNARSMFDVARVLGSAVREIHKRDGRALRDQGVDFNVSMILGGQIDGEGTRLFQIYSAGNFIEATAETCFFQIGESKYGKPVLDRILTPKTTLDEAAKCLLVSMDSTLKSNLSVGLPLDMVIYSANTLGNAKIMCLDESNPYFQHVHTSWGPRLREAFDAIANPAWDILAEPEHPIVESSTKYAPMLKILSPTQRVA
jgi:putative proteasome-type protease